MTTGGRGYNSTQSGVPGGYQSRYLSGWCGRCGRKRGADGRCADCDGWWTSPLLTTGAPVIALGTAFLFAALPLLRHRSFTTVYAAPPALLSSPASPGSFITPVVSPPVMRPQQPNFATGSLFPSASFRPVSVPLALSPPDPAIEQARLQTMAVYADSLLRAEQSRREAALWSSRHQFAVRTFYTIPAPVTSGSAPVQAESPFPKPASPAQPPLLPVSPPLGAESAADSARLL